MATHKQDQAALRVSSCMRQSVLIVKYHVTLMTKNLRKNMLISDNSAGCYRHILLSLELEPGDLGTSNRLLV
jgi:hypothetical protein